MDIIKENKNKKGLGRGMHSLFDQSPMAPAGSGAESSDYSKKQEESGLAAKTVAQEVDAEARIWKIAIDKMVPGAYQPRKHFDKMLLEELATSIKENGLIQPITVRKRPAGGFEIIAGERRWRASQLAGLHEVPAIIKTVTDKEALQIAIIENIQREDLDPIEEAESYQRLMTEFGYSQQEVSERVGKERSTVANALRLIQLPNELKEMLADKILSVGHAKSLLSVADKPMQVKLAKECAAKGWSVRALENEIKAKTKSNSKAQENAKGLNIDVASKLAHELADQIQKKLGTKTEINYKSGKGQVILHFYSDEQLNQIYEKLNT
ncbi:MAG: ParB/RepB/Spo0J family partition protein [Bdellovibrio sp.]|nr:ParB/RepB/Spo0J family partition protein [Bdellovibrio sp.]